MQSHQPYKFQKQITLSMRIYIFYSMLHSNELLEGLNWDRSVVVQDVTFVPVCNPHAQPMMQMHLVHELDNMVSIEEMENESVNEIYFISKSDQPLLILSGLIVEGGKQTRTITRPFIVNGEKKVKIPVNCVEQGRWFYTGSRKFTLSRKMVSRRTKSYAMRGAEMQSTTWRSIRETMDEFGVNRMESPTESFLDVERVIRSTRRDLIEKAREAILPAFTVKNQTGIAIFENGELTYAELFNSTDLWKKVWESVLDANLIDTASMLLDPKEEIPAKPHAPKLLISKTIPVCDEEAFEVRAGKHVTGWMVAFNGIPVHLTIGAQDMQRERRRFIRNRYRQRQEHIQEQRHEFFEGEENMALEY